tara:strand:+ start:3380 stop:3811 length:432 start_codon:yes stop_codon:yes gene_type:complete
MSIRLLEIGDYHKNYLQLMNQLKPTKIYSYAKFKKIFKQIEKNEEHNIFVIEEDGIIVGTITVVLETKFIYEGEKLGHIEDFVVDKNYRKKGYGGNLIEHVINFCKKNDCRKIGLCSRPCAQEFYYKKGFDVIGNYFAKYLKV